MGAISKFISKDIGDLSKLFGIEKGSLSKVMGIDIPPAGPAYVDYYADTADGFVGNTDADFYFCRGAATGNLASDNNAYATPAIATYLAGGLYRIYRTFLYFDLSAATPGFTAVELHLTANDDGGSGFYDVMVQEGTQGATLSTADYDAFTGEFGIFSISGSPTVVNMTLELDGLMYIQSVVGGMAKLCLREHYYDFKGKSAPSGYGGYFGVYFSESDDKPFLRLIY